MDTDLQLATLASLLEPASFPTEDLLEALMAAQGDLTRAAESLLLPRIRSSGKRKAGASLESWLGRKKGGTLDSDIKSPIHEQSMFDNGSRTKRAQEKVVETIKVESQAGVKSSPSLMSILRQPMGDPGIGKAKNPPRPPISLPDQNAIDHHRLPLTLLRSPLSPAFASALYLTMMEESKDWESNKFYLAGKWVESPHLVSTYHKVAVEDVNAAAAPGHHEEGTNGTIKKASYMWSGQEVKPSKLYPALLREAANLIEPIVNAAMEGRARYPLEWAGDWEASICGANRYDGANSSVGWHADQLTYQNFAGSSPIRTYETILGHNSLVLMNAGCQERYKHTVPTQRALDVFRPGYDTDQSAIPLHAQKTYTARINITFRFHRTDFHPLPGIGPYGPREGTPECKCGIPTLLRADQKAKARTKFPPISPKKRRLGAAPESKDATDPEASSGAGLEVVDDDMVYFWQCQSPGQTGDLKGCGFFRILDMKKEGRGPCIVDSL